MRPRAVVMLSSTAAFLVAAYATLSPSGLAHLSRMSAEQRALSAERDALVLENHKLEQQIQALRGEDAPSLGYLEKVVRDELGYLRSDELLFVPKAKPKALAPAASPASSATPTSPQPSEGTAR